MSTPPIHDPGQLTLSLREHNIGFSLPAGATLEGALLNLPHGALISGTFVGTLKCEHGSVIIAATARIRGVIEADRIYIEGEVASSKNIRTKLAGRWLVAASSDARINADLFSNAFALHKPKFWGQVFTMDDYFRQKTESKALSAQRAAQFAKPAAIKPPAIQQQG